MENVAEQYGEWYVVFKPQRHEGKLATDEHGLTQIVPVKRNKDV